MASYKFVVAWRYKVSGSTTVIIYHSNVDSQSYIYGTEYCADMLMYCRLLLLSGAVAGNRPGSRANCAKD